MSDDDLIRGPKWRTRTTPRRRARAVVVTGIVIVAVGVVLLGATIVLLDRLGAPVWVTTLPWWGPTAGVIGWTLTNPSPAVATDSDDDSWGGYVIRYALVGEGESRPLPVRVVTAVVLGAPMAWAMLVFGLLALLGLFEL